MNREQWNEYLLERYKKRKAWLEKYQDDKEYISLIVHPKWYERYIHGERILI
jgi:hypothetical protein